MRACPLLLLAVACSGSRSDGGTPILVTSTIGPEGGVVVVDSGPQRGLRLTFPPGAVPAPTVIRIRDVSANPPLGTYALQSVPVPGKPFVIEPAGLRLDVQATLRAPYVVNNVRDTAPGNVLVRELRSGNAIEHEPELVDIAGGFVELSIRHLTQYVVKTGPVTPDRDSYLRVPGVIQLGNDATFEARDIDAASPFAVSGGRHWRIRLPQRDESLFFDPDGLRGRESVGDGWRERWPQSVPVLLRADEVVPSSAITQQIQVERPIGAPPVPGQMTAFGMWSWAEPRVVAGRMLRDVLQLRVTLAWMRTDLGVGQRVYLFWFAPNVGLVALSEDGVGYARTTL
jgi:hypothetical protein